jgi:hypothetical protein
MPKIPIEMQCRKTGGAFGASSREYSLFNHCGWWKSKVFVPTCTQLSCGPMVPFSLLVFFFQPIERKLYLLLAGLSIYDKANIMITVIIRIRIPIYTIG